MEAEPAVAWKKAQREETKAEKTKQTKGSRDWCPQKISGKRTKSCHERKRKERGKERGEIWVPFNFIGLIYLLNLWIWCLLLKQGRSIYNNYSNHLEFWALKIKAFKVESLLMTILLLSLQKLCVNKIPIKTFEILWTYLPSYISIYL